MRSLAPIAGLAAAALLVGTTPARAINAVEIDGNVEVDESTWTFGPGKLVYDARSYGVVCDGTTDDRAVLDAAMDALTATGGVLRIPNTGNLCLIDDSSGAGLDIESNVDIQCAPGAGFIAKSDAVFTHALLDGTGENNWAVRDCEIDLNGTSEAAIDGGAPVAGVEILNNWIHGNGTTGTGQTLVTVYGGGSPGNDRPNLVEGNLIECNGDASDDDEIGIYAVAGANNRSTRIVGNVVQDCDKTGIHIWWYAQAHDNHVWGEDDDAVGIEADQYTRATGNYIYMTGADAKGIWVSEKDVQTSNNKVVMTGTGAKIGIHSDGGSFGSYQSSNDAVSLTGTANDSAGYVLDGESNISNCDVQVSSDGTDTFGILAYADANSSQIDNCHIYGGDFGIGPPLDNSVSGCDLAGANVRITDNVVTFQAQAAVILAGSGWHLTGNTINWQLGGDANVWIGLDGSTFGTAECETGHSVITGNNFHSNSNVENHIKFAMFSGGDQYNVVITGNDGIGTFRAASANAAPIDFGQACASNCSDVTGTVVSGNSWLMTNADYLYTFNTVSNYEIVIGPNAETNGIFTEAMFKNWDASYGTWTARPRRMCGRFSNVDLDTDNQMLTMEGSDNGGGYIIRARAICQGDCTTQADIQLQKLECAGGANVGNYCDDDSTDCPGSTCGVDIGTEFNGLNPATEETTDWSDINVAVDEEDLIGFDVENTPTAGDEYLICIWYLP